MSEANNQLFVPLSETFGGYAPREECIRLARQINRIIDGARYLESRTPYNVLQCIPTFKVQSRGPFLPFIEYARTFLSTYVDIIYDDDPDYDSKYLEKISAFIRNLEDFDKCSLDGTFGISGLNFRIRKGAIGIIRSMDREFTVEDGVFHKLADELETTRGVIFSDVLNWDYILDEMEKDN